MAIPAPFDDAPIAVRTVRDVIRASGPDAETFLQGQLSQDISRLAPGEAAWSLVLQPQGKVDAWLRVTRIDAEEFLLDVDAGAAEATLARLNRFKLRTACDLTAASWHIVSIRGLGADAVEVPVTSGAEVVVPAGWPGVGGIDALGPDVAIPDGLTEASGAELEELRVMAGVPTMGAELTGATIPAEAGIVERSVSFTKGCFTGQELVARIDSRGGNVPRHLRGLVINGHVAVGESVVIDGAEVGQVTSVAGEVALAYIKRSVASFPVDASVGGVAASVRELPLF